MRLLLSGGKVTLSAGDSSSEGGRAAMRMFDSLRLLKRGGTTSGQGSSDSIDGAPREFQRENVYDRTLVCHLGDDRDS
jgi:hypothetical protein